MGPLRPILFSRGAVSYETAKELARILKSLVGKAPHHVNNTRDCATYQGYPVTSVPIWPAMKIIQDQLDQDRAPTKNIHTVNNIISLLEFCLRSTYFLFQGRYYEQLEGTGMVSHMPCSSQSVHGTCWSQSPQHIALPPSLGKRYVDDTFVVIKTVHKCGFMEHINSIDHCIQFTEEATRADGSMPFLDAQAISQPDGNSETTVYRKATDTEQYLHWDSHHTISGQL